jgi:hypothetical protein
MLLAVINKGSFIIGNQELYENEQLVSPNGLYKAKLQLDGNFVVFVSIKYLN